MKKKYLEKAVILGLILSTGVYGTAWAEEYSETNNPYNTSITDTDNTVTGDVVFELDKKALITNNGGTVTVDDKTTNGSLTVTTNADKIIDSNGGTNNITMQGGIFLGTQDNKTNSAYGLYNSFGSIDLESQSADADIIIDVKSAGLTNNDIVAGIYNINNDAEILKDNNININTVGTFKISASDKEAKQNTTVYGIGSRVINEDIFNPINNAVNTTITAGNVNINVSGFNDDSKAAIYMQNALFNGSAENTLSVTATAAYDESGESDNRFISAGKGINITNLSGSIANIMIESKNNSNILISNRDSIEMIAGKLELNAENGRNEINSNNESAIIARESDLTLNAKENIINSKLYGIDVATDMMNYTSDNFDETIKIISNSGNNEISSAERQALYLHIQKQNGTGLLPSENSQVELTANQGNNIIKGHTILNNDNIYPDAAPETIRIYDGNLTVEATADNTDEKTGINEIWAGRVTTTVNGLTTGNYEALEISGSQDRDKLSTATFTADTANKFYGSLYAEDKAVVDIASKDNEISSRKSSSSNLDYSYAVVADGNRLKDDVATTDIDERTQINITANGGANTIFSTGDIKDERTVFATEGGVVNIEGTSIITADGWLKANESGYQANSTSQALIAGTHDWGNTTPNFDVADEERSEINLIYGNGSAITGDIAAGYAGAINIIDQSSGSGAVGISTMAEGQDTSAAGNSLTIMGNALAANGGKINLELGKGSVWQGRADDYQDAADENWAQAHLGEFNAVFSNDVQAEGAVNVALNDGATWDVMGQSWLTKLGGNDGVIDMRNTEGDDSRTSHAVHIGELNGSHTFVMDLDTNHAESDMLYIKDMGESSGTQTLWINSIKGLENLGENDTLRFATVSSGDIQFKGQYNFGSYGNARNGVMLMDNGVLDTAYKIVREDYVPEKVEENTGYNGTGFDEVKPGNEYVEDNYAAYNWLIAKDSTHDKVSDAGKTIINMSKVNYNNAIYMDRLNKRLGEARYISPEDEQGMWVRIRHDRIGKDDAFRSQNTMYEMGYDVKQDCDNGERRLGMAIDYMDGKAEYTGIAGDGDVKRYGLWLYDTWLGDKGHYTDYVLKWGHLENDFDIMARTTGEKITGDYSNNVFSASAEYGKKNDMGGGWYFEPQAQLQFARVTGADYVTSQDTKVSLDGINSLIGRAGFRLGRDLNENSTVYVKADLLHEFLGDQDITATDITGTLREEYENEGTWYDIGFGFATALGNNSYAFMDFEKSFGNDNDETYQINAGVRWTF